MYDDMIIQNTERFFLNSEPFHMNYCNKANIPPSYFITL